jgi:hypothetical protein
MEELITLRTYIETHKYDEALQLISELEEMSLEDKINKIGSFVIVLLIHLIKQEAEKRTTKSWEISIRNAVWEINRTNKRRKAGGSYLTPEELSQTIADSYPMVLARASLEAFEGQYRENRVGRHAGPRPGANQGFGANQYLRLALRDNRRQAIDNNL